MFVTFRTDHINSMNGYMYLPKIMACSIIGKSVRNNFPGGFAGTLLEVAPNILRGYVRNSNHKIIDRFGIIFHSLRLMSGRCYSKDVKICDIPYKKSK